MRKKLKMKDSFAIGLLDCSDAIVLFNYIAPHSFSEKRNEPVECVSDVLANLNDNGKIYDTATGTVFNPPEYEKLRSRKAFQNKKLIEQMARIISGEEYDPEEETFRHVADEFEKRYQIEKDVQDIDEKARAKYETFRKERRREEAHRRLAA